jgi:hypothetical protein
MTIPENSNVFWQYRKTHPAEFARPRANGHVGVSCSARQMFLSDDFCGIAFFVPYLGGGIYQVGEMIEGESAVVIS